jgi:hypothetical protein
MAIFSDIISIDYRVDSRHKTGVNVLYANGGAKWVDRKIFDSDLKLSSASRDTSDGIKPQYNPYQFNIWKAFDRY